MVTENEGYVGLLNQYREILKAGYSIINQDNIFKIYCKNKLKENCEFESFEEAEAFLLKEINTITYNIKILFNRGLGNESDSLEIKRNEEPTYEEIDEIVANYFKNKPKSWGNLKKYQFKIFCVGKNSI